MFLVYLICVRFTVLFGAPLELWPLKKRSWMDVSVSVDRGGVPVDWAAPSHTEKTYNCSKNNVRNPVTQFLKIAFISTLLGPQTAASSPLWTLNCLKY